MDKTVSTEVDYLADRLKPLFTGKPVAIQFFSAATKGRKKDPIVALTPGSIFGWPSNRVLLSVVHHGSCILHLETARERKKREKRGEPFKPQLTDMILAGLSAKMARLLMETLTTLNASMKEKKHGTSTNPTRTTSAPQRRRGTKPRCTPYRES